MKKNNLYLAKWVKMQMVVDNNFFFDSYPEFFDTSSVGSSPNRLNNRYKALIGNNSGIIKNSVVLDLASHDGRWSFAALMSGASKVVGIEGRRELVDRCHNTMNKYGVPNEKYSFIVGDLFEEIKNINEKIDVVFCFGIIYHVMDHMSLLSSIKKLRPHYFLLDSNVSGSDNPIIELKLENINDPAAAIKANRKYHAIVGWPSKKAIELMLSDVGFDFSYYDWQRSGIVNWEDIEDYQKGKTVSIVAKNLDY